jgi:hypothetical protein
MSDRNDNSGGGRKRGAMSPKEIRDFGKQVQDQDQTIQNLEEGVLNPLDALVFFENAGTLEDKVEAGKLIQGYLSGGGLDETTRKQLQTQAQQLKVDEYMSLYKLSLDLDTVSETSFLSTGGRTPQIERMDKGEWPRIQQENKQELQRLKDDTTLDPFAQKTAMKLATYLPATESFIEKNQDPKTFSIKDDTFEDLGNGERLIKPRGLNKVVIQDQKGGLVMRPQMNDDPRKLHMVAVQMREFLDPSWTRKGEHSDGKSLGFRVLQDIQNGSQLIQDSTNEFIQRAQALDGERMDFMIEDGSNKINAPRQLEDQRQRQKQELEDKQSKKKKGFSLFKKKEKDQDSSPKKKDRDRNF